MTRRTTVAIGFLGLIFVGAIVLASPWSRQEGTWGAPLTALFTACSAVCVTGLTVVDIGREFTREGLLALMVLVQLGCLGLMTLGTFLMIAVGRRLSLDSEFSLMNAYGIAAVKGLNGLTCWVVASMLVIEAAGAMALYPVFGDWFDACFYSIMGFCNAGFGFRPGSLANYGEWYPLLVMALLTILGGIGFLVIYNLCTFRFLRRNTGGRGRLTLHTRVVLRFTLYLLVAAFVAFIAIEWNRSLASFDWSHKLVVGFYQAVTPRTCGFTVIPTESLQPITRLLYEALMFVGGAPGSAAAGVKVTTFAVLIYTLTAMCRGETETVISRRAISVEIVRESIVIFMALVAIAGIVYAALLLTESPEACAKDALFFEAVSAVTTTGLSVGSTTASLSSAGKFVIMLAMFAGRLGALTVVLMIGDRESVRRVRFPSEELVVG